MTYLSGETLEILGRLVKLADAVSNGKGLSELEKTDKLLGLFSTDEIAAACKLDERETFR